MEKVEALIEILTGQRNAALDAAARIAADREVLTAEVNALRAEVARQAEEVAKHKPAAPEITEN